MFRFAVFADDFFSRLRRSRPSRPAAKIVPVPEPSIGDKAKEKRPMKDDLLSGTTPPKKMKSHARREHRVTSGEGALETEFSE